MGPGGSGSGCRAVQGWIYIVLGVLGGFSRPGMAKLQNQKFFLLSSTPNHSSVVICCCCLTFSVNYLDLLEERDVPLTKTFRNFLEKGMSASGDESSEELSSSGLVSSSSSSSS